MRISILSSWEYVYLYDSKNFIIATYEGLCEVYNHWFREKIYIADEFEIWISFLKYNIWYDIFNYIYIIDI